MVENTQPQDLSERINTEWADMVALQPEAAQFIDQSQKKPLDGLNLFAFFNNKLVRTLLIKSSTLLEALVLTMRYIFRTLVTDFSSKKAGLMTRLKLASARSKKAAPMRQTMISSKKHLRTHSVSSKVAEPTQIC